MAKADLIQELAHYGVTTTGVSEQLAEMGFTPITGEEVNRDLEALIDKVKAALPPSFPAFSSARPTASEPPGPPSTPSPQEPPAPPADNTAEVGAPKSGSVDIIKGKNQYVRTYSKEVHGDDFFMLAQQLVSKDLYSKREYRIVDSADVPELAVLYREKKDAELPLDDQSPDSPMVDKQRVFTDRNAALAFNVEKKGSIIVRGL